MSNVVISPTSAHTPVAVTADEFLTIAVGAYIIANGSDDAIVLPGTIANGEVDIEGSIVGDDALVLSYNSGDEAITVGSTGSVTGAGEGLYLNSFHTGTQTIQNAGYVHGGDEAISLNMDDAVVENAGSIVGGDTGVHLKSPNGGFVENEGSGLITGQSGVIFDGASARVVNAGTISSTSTNGRAINATGSNANIVNSGDIEGGAETVFLNGGSDFLQNSGTINSSFGVAFDAEGANVEILNSGKISSEFTTIFLGGSGGSDWIVNQSGGLIQSQDNTYALYVAGDAAHIINHGDLFGGIAASNLDDVFTNTGDYTGHAVLGGGATVRNAGQMSQDGEAMGPGSSMNGDDIAMYGVMGYDDRIVNTVNGVINGADSGAIYHTADGTLRIVNHGDIYGEIDVLGQTSIANVGLINGNVSFGIGSSVFVNRGFLNGSIVFAGAGNIYRGQAGEVTGTIYGAGADGRYLGGASDDTFDMTASGAKYVSGGAGDDTFLFTAAGLTSSTRVLGGAGDDSLTFTTVATFSPSAFAHVSGIETINLAAGNNNLALTDALVGSADGDALTINGNNFVDTINASAVTTATDTVTMYGGHGADVMTAGGAKDVFLYQAVNESSGTVYDTIAAVNFNIDRFDVSAAAKTVLAVNTAVTTGSLSTATFNADLATDLPAAKLGAHDAVLFTASAGTLSGQTFLVIDANGTAGYQANADLVIHLTGQTGTLAAASFT